MVCFNCNARVKKDSEFCTNCGLPLINSQKSSSLSLSKRKLGVKKAGAKKKARASKKVPQESLQATTAGAEAPRSRKKRVLVRNVSKNTRVIALPPDSSITQSLQSRSTFASQLSSFGDSAGFEASGETFSDMQSEKQRAASIIKPSLQEADADFTASNSGYSFETGTGSNPERVKALLTEEASTDNVLRAKLRHRSSRSPSQRRSMITIYCAIACLLTITLSAAGLYASRSGRYNRAVAAFRSGDHEKAQSLFKQTEEYKDSRSYLSYLDGLASMQQDRYEDAAVVFEGLAGFEDAEKRAAECNDEIVYTKAIALYQQKDYAAASALFERIGNYKDSLLRLEACVVARPKTGELTHPKSSGEDARLNISLSEDSESDAYYKLLAAGSDDAYTGYIRTGESVGLKLPEGSYSLKIAFGNGTKWYGPSGLFGSQGVYLIYQENSSAQWELSSSKDIMLKAEQGTVTQGEAISGPDEF